MKKNIVDKGLSMMNNSYNYPCVLPAPLVASPCDIDEVAALYDSLNDFLEAGVNYPCWKKCLYPTLQTAKEGIDTQTLYVIKIGGEIAGTVILNHRQPSQYSLLQWGVNPPTDKVITVNTLAVHPKFFKQRVAEALLHFADELCLRQGISTLRLDVSVNNAPAIKLYEKLGYTLVGDVDLCLNIKGLELFHCYEKVFQK